MRFGSAGGSTALLSEWLMGLPRLPTATVWRWGDWQAAWPGSPGWLLWWALLGLGLAVLPAVWRSPRGHLGRVGVLASLRVAAVLLLILMIGGLQRLAFEEEPSDLILLIDNSQSMAAPERSFSRAAFLEPPTGPPSAESRWQRLRDVLTGDPLRLARLADRYQVEMHFLEGTEASPGLDTSGGVADRQRLAASGPTAVQSPLGQALQAALLRQRGRPTAAVVLLSDGIVNAGPGLLDVVPLADEQGVPVVTVGFGSDAPAVDVAIDEVLADATALLGDTVEVRGIVRTMGTEQQRVVVRLIDQETDAVYDSEVLAGSQAERFEALRFSFVAKQAKRYELAVVAEPLEAEADPSNNRRSLAVEVRDEPLRVLLVQDRPSYEFRFLKHLLERTTVQSQGGAPRVNDEARRLVELTAVLQSGDPAYADQDRSAVRLPPVGIERIAGFDVVVLSDAAVPLLGAVFLEQLATAVRERGVGLVVIAGPDHLPEELADTALDPLLPVDPRRVEPPALPVRQPQRMALTPLGRQTAALRLQEQGTAELPWIYGAWRAPTLRPAARVLMETRSIDGGGRNADPLLVSQLVGAGEVWVQLTDQTYRLQPFDGRGELYRRYWLQILRRLARGKRRTQGSLATLDVIGDRFPAGAEIPVRARLPQGPGEAAGEGRVTIDVRGPAEERQVVLAPSAGDLFRGVIPPLAPGSYRAVVVDPPRDGPPIRDRFTVEATPLEWSRLRSALETLQQLAAETGGSYLSSQEAVAGLEAALPPSQSVGRRPLPPQPLWNHPLTVGLLIGLVCGEWILRRRWAR